MKYYQAEMHCHTREVSPCSHIPAKYLAEDYAACGYKYLFVTDHYHPLVFESPFLKGACWDERVDYFLSGYRAAAEAARGTDLTVFCGMEVVLGRDEETGIGNDFLVYGFGEGFLRKYPYLYRYPYEDFYALAKENGLLVFQAHPYRYGLTPVMPVCYDGIEIVNTHPGHQSHNRLAVQFALEHGLYMIGGSDAHQEQDIGRGGVMLPGDISSPRDLVAFYREHGSPELIVTFGA